MKRDTFKKITGLFLAAAILIAGSACNNSAQDAGKTSSAAPATATASAPSSGQAATASAAPTQTANAGKTDHYPVTIETYKFSKESIPEVFEKSPERVYVMYPCSLENMLALGLEDKIAKLYLGDEASEKAMAFSEKFGSAKLTKEEILGANIDFILGWYSTFSDKHLGEVDYWQEKGIKTYMALNSSVKKPAPNTLEDEYQDILNLGKIFNVEDRAQKIIAEMESRIQKAQEKVKEKGKVRTLVLEVEKDNQYRLYGPSTIGGVIAEKVGADLLTDAPRITGEELVALNPDVIFTVYFGSSSELNEKTAVELLNNNPALKSISAIKEGKIYPTPLAYTYAPGVRAMEAIDFFANALYPEK